MPIFEVEKNGQVFEVEAADETTALAALGNAAPAESPLDSAGRGMGNAMLMGGAPYVGGAVEYALQGGAPGSFTEGYDRSEQATANSEAQNPNAYGAGALGGLATEAALMGGPPIAAGIKAFSQSPNAVKWVARQLLNYFVPGSGTIMEAGGVARSLQTLGGAGRSPAARSMESDIAKKLFKQQGRSGGTGSYHERNNSLETIMKREGENKHLTREQYEKRYGRNSNAARRARGYANEREIERDFPETYE